MSQRRSERLLKTLASYDEVLVVTHDFPDPDAIAAGWALYTLFKRKLSGKCRLVGGGDIVRAENVELVRLLHPPIDLIPELKAGPKTATVLVDCGPSAENNLVARSGLRPVAAIDHHMTASDREKVTFADVRPNAAATVSIVWSYLQEQEVEPGTGLATAMLYAIRTETFGHETHFSPLDRKALAWLTERADPSKLAQIQNAPLPRTYFSELVLALQNTFVYGEGAFCLLPQASGPETVAEVADLLVRCEGVKQVLCAGQVGANVMLSVRTAPDGGNAAELVRALLKGLGSGGGHGHRAGGKIERKEDGVSVSSGLQQTLRSRWMELLRIERKRGERLVAKRDIVDNL